MGSTLENPNVVGPAVGTPGRLRRLERAIRDQQVVNGGDIEVLPAETGVGRILRLSTWLRARLGIMPGEASNAAVEEEATHGLHIDVAVGASAWTLTYANVTLPHWLRVYPTNLADQCVIPFGVVSGTVFIQLMITPSFISTGGGGQYLAIGYVRIISDIQGSTPYVASQATYDTPSTLVTFPDPMLWLPVCKFVGDANGSFALTYIGTCRVDMAPFDPWLQWSTSTLLLRHGVSVDIGMVVGGFHPFNVNAGHVTLSPRLVAYDGAFTTLTPVAPYGREYPYPIYLNISTSFLTQTGYLTPIGPYFPLVAMYSSDGNGNVLQLRSCSTIPFVQSY